MRVGLLQRTPKGRIATAEAYQYFNIKHTDKLF
jgi:Holliday junction resolvasome RuvABC ATP-dependent DNA helicase subunit